MKLLKVLALCTVLLGSWAWAGDVININTADESTLAKVMIGVGKEKAKAIVSYRKQYGDFKTIDDLTKVSGIGKVTLDKNRSKIKVSGKSSVSESTDKTAKSDKKDTADKKATESKKDDSKKTDDKKTDDKKADTKSKNVDSKKSDKNASDKKQSDSKKAETKKPDDKSKPETKK